MSGTHDIMTREHKVFAARSRHWSLNYKAFKGGDDYINERLVRPDGESDLSWSGESRPLGIASGSYKGRKQRTSYVNDAGRVVDKINQYLFKSNVTRAGIDGEWARDVTGLGVGIDSFFSGLSEHYTLCGLVWVQVDRDGSSKTFKEKREKKDVVRWTIWPASSVPDWAFGSDGKLLWILVESAVYDNSDPMAAPIEAKVRTLFHKRDGAVYKSEYFDKTIDGMDGAKDELLPGAKEIPFACVGVPSCDPWWFDDVEGIQMQLLNLDSLHSNNLTQAAFPQLVIPISALRNVEAKISKGKDGNDHLVTKVSREILRSAGNPIIEGQGDHGTTRYIMPSSEGIRQIPDEISRKRAMMYQNAGCALLYQETRQIQSADSKQFDLLDTESALKNRALMMQKIEEALVGMSCAIDAGFKKYDASWPLSFDIVDAQEVERIAQAVDNTALVTPTMHKMKLRMLVRMMVDQAGCSKEDEAAANKEIDEIDAEGFAEHHHGWPPSGEDEDDQDGSASAD